MHAHYHTLIQLALGALVLSGLSALVWAMSTADNDGLVTGRVLAVAPSSFTVTDRYNEEVEVQVDDSTVIREGRTRVSFATITPGRFVQVRAVATEHGVVAESITVLNPPGHKEPDHAN